MKSSIFKSYVKKVLRSEAFLSVIIVFVLALGIIGTSYALYMDVDTDTDYQVVQVGNLFVGFSNDGDNTVILENMLPMENEYALDSDESNGKPALYSFYLYNGGTYTAQYDIKLVAGEGNEIDTKYINYIVCKDNSLNCSDIKSFDSLNESLVTSDELSPKKDSDLTNPSVYYFLKIWVNSDYVTEKVNGEKIELKVNVEATNASGYLDNENTLAGAILNNDNIKIYNINPDFSSENIEDGIYKTEDDYGTSYYFRGNSNYNYVNFANKCWRVVRVEGDGSVKLVLASDKVCNSENLTDMSSFAFTTTFNKSGIINYNESEIKLTLDRWANDSFDSKDINSIKQNEKWCLGDISNAYGENDEVLGNVIDYQTNNMAFNYINFVRLDKLNKPSLKCNSNEELTNVELLENMVGTLTADEVYFAGRNSYLKDNSKGYWWTITPARYDTSNKDSVYWVDENNTLQSGSPIFVNHDKNLVYVRPTITLLNDTLVNSGKGTISDPYIIN